MLDVVDGDRLAGMVPRGHVYAFEASRENFDYLERNLVANGLTNVTAERVAVYDGSTDRLELSVAADNTAGSFVSATGHREGDVEVVPAVTLDAGVAARGLERVDLVKLDVEGAEPRVLDGVEPAGKCGRSRASALPADGNRYRLARRRSRGRRCRVARVKPA